MNLYGFGPIRVHLRSRQPCPPAARPPARQLSACPPAAGPVGINTGAHWARLVGSISPGQVRYRPGPGAFSAISCSLEGAPIEYSIFYIEPLVYGLNPLQSISTAPIEYSIFNIEPY